MATKTFKVVEMIDNCLTYNFSQNHPPWPLCIMAKNEDLNSITQSSSCHKTSHLYSSCSWISWGCLLRLPWLLCHPDDRCLRHYNYNYGNDILDVVTDVLVTANYSALSYQLAGQHKCCTETYHHHHHQQVYAGGLYKLTTKTQLSPGIILMSGGAHDGGMLQS